MIRYLSVEDLIRIQHGIAPNTPLRDPGLLDAAVARARSGFGDHEAYPTVHEKAAAILHSLASTQAFVDGNKRTAVMAMYEFLAINHWLLTMDEADLYHLTLDTATGKYDVAKIASVLLAGSRPVPD